MKIKRFEGKSFTAVMALVKKEFGKDAVIISTENIDGKITVTAAKDYDLDNAQASIDRRDYPGRGMAERSYGENSYSAASAAALQSIKRQANQEQNGEMMGLGALDNSIEIEALKSDIKKQKDGSTKQEEFFLRELAMLRESLSSLLRNSVGKDSSLPLCYTPYLKSGIEVGIEEELLKSILDKTGMKAKDVFVDELEAQNHLRSFFTNVVKIRDLYNEIDKNGGVFAFVGPTGVGKTTTLVKIATNLILQQNRQDIAFVSLDFVRADGAEQLKRYSNILGIPFYACNSAESYSRTIEQLKKQFKIVLVDTAGISPLNKSSLEFLEKVCKNNYTQSILHIPVATEYEHALSIIEVFSEAAGEVMIAYTKEDESFRNGLIASLTIGKKVTACFLTNGQRIPEDIKCLKNAGDLTDIIFSRKM